MARIATAWSSDQAALGRAGGWEAQILKTSRS
jgi:hypothetical protein